MDPLTKPQKFSVAVAGNGLLLTGFVQLLKRQYPGVLIYDRNEEASRPASNAPIPSHPKVADVDAIFILTGSRETATIRSGRGHRYFSYLPDSGLTTQPQLDFLLKQTVLAVGKLL